MGSSFYEGGEGTIQQVVELGTGAVSDDTVKIVGSVPKRCRVTGIRLYGQSAVTATALTGIVYARTTAGGAGNALNTAADIDFASAAAAKTGVQATLASADNLFLDENQLLELHVDADACTVGPGDVLVEIQITPRA